MIDVIYYWIDVIADIVSSLWLLRVTDSITFGGLCVGCLIVTVICSFLYAKLVK